MTLQKLNDNFTVCKVVSIENINFGAAFCFIGKTDEEISLVCPTANAPTDTTEKEDGWKGFRIQGTLDFSLIGIISEISAILAKNEIGIFAVSTYNTDYIFVKSENFEKAISALISAGYNII